MAATTTQLDDRFTDTDAAIIRIKAARLVGHYGWRRQDQDDLEQDLCLHVVERSHHYRADRGSRQAFVMTAVKHKVLNMIESRMAQKRDARRLRGGHRTPTPDGRVTEAKTDLRIDVWTVLARVPAELRQVAVLRRQHTEAEVQQLLSITRQQLRGRMRKLAAIFRQAGLDPSEIFPAPTIPQANPVVSTGGLTL